MKVALATDDLVAVNAHFGKAAHLAIYDVTPAGWTHAQTVGFEEIDGGEDGTDRIAPRIAALSNCTLLFLKGIGGTAAAKVVKARVHPIALQQDEPVADVLERVRRVLADGPPPWLRKRMEVGEAAGV